MLVGGRSNGAILVFVQPANDPKVVQMASVAALRRHSIVKVTLYAKINEPSVSLQVQMDSMLPLLL